MKKISGKRSEDDAKIDLTPMLDVVFILLIFCGNGNFPVGDLHQRGQ